MIASVRDVHRKRTRNRRAVSKAVWGGGATAAAARAKDESHSAFGRLPWTAARCLCATALSLTESHSAAAAQVKACAVVLLCCAKGV
jgi:hypothetical protein